MPRAYRQRARLRHQEETRQRIVKATAALHEEVGPAGTTISAIAERAGVQRLTVYRHFPGQRDLFGACSAHWSAAHQPPDPSVWAGLSDPRDRLEVALAALYAFYRGGERMLEKILRDAESIPALAEVIVPFGAYQRRLAGDLMRGWRGSKRARRLLRASVAHAIEFPTWRSLASQGLSDVEAAKLMAALAAGASGLAGLGEHEPLE